MMGGELTIIEEGARATVAQAHATLALAFAIKELSGIARTIETDINSISRLIR